MRATRLAPRLASFFVALCVPLLCASQTSTVPLTAPVSPQSSPSASPEISRDSATRLEGRLFFSPQERQRMDEARKRGVVFGDDGKFVEIAPSVLNGFVKRNDGNIAVWVDGDLRWNAQSKSASSLVPTDVGGPAQYVKAASGDAVSHPTKSNARAKKAVKPRVNSIIKPRLLP